MNETNNFNLMNSIINALVEEVASRVTARLQEDWESLNLKIDNTLGNTKPILENLLARIEKLENHTINATPTAPTAEEYKATIREIVEEMVEAAIEDSDLDSKAERAVEDAVQNTDFNDYARDAIREEVDGVVDNAVTEYLDDNLEEKVQELLNNATVEISL